MIHTSKQLKDKVRNLSNLERLYNHSVFSINTICNYDRDIIPYIHAEIGSVYIRTGSNTFEIDDGSKPIFVDKQKR